MKENECKSVHKRGVGCFSALFRSVTCVSGLQKKVLLFAVCCCGVLSFRVSVVV
jgi:hypothetical protein